jgi:hypothetical protein
MASLWQPPVAFAASAALIAGLLLGGLFQGREALAPADSVWAGRVIAPDSPLHALFESGLSGAPMALAGEAAGQIVLTFQDAAGDYCRQAQVDAPAATIQALACRRADAWQWQVASFDEAPAADAGLPYRPAAATPAPAIEAAIDRLIGDHLPLGAEAEAERVRSGWDGTEH